MADENGSVIVFGPTGSVGGATAAEARRHGAKVWLAMRDTSKKIQSFDSTGEGYERIEADLHKPDTVRRAVEKSRATRAFFYWMTTDDGMRSTIDALKTSGIKYIVFLSSFSVRPSPRAVDPNDFISAGHARIELSLEDSGVPFTAVRPAYFDTNIFWYAEGIKQGRVEILQPDFVVDFIAPEDIGAVCGTLLAGKRYLSGERPREVYLAGPRLMTYREGFGLVARYLGREIEVVGLTPEEYVEQNKKSMPLELVHSVIRGLSGEPGKMYEGLYEQASRNKKEITGVDSMTLEEWVRIHM